MQTSAAAGSFATLQSRKSMTASGLGLDAAVQRGEQKTKRSYLPKFPRVLPEVKVARLLQIESKIDAILLDFGCLWCQVGYDAKVRQDNGDETKISGHYDAWITSLDLIYHFSEGPVVPYLGAGIGWTWVDTNVPNRLPQTGCCWDPWWGYVCSNYQSATTTEAFSYQATAGIGYEHTTNSLVRSAYTSQRMDVGRAKGTLRFDVLGVESARRF
jgi:opacity protein-like surface antigen